MTEQQGHRKPGVAPPPNIAPQRAPRNIISLKRHLIISELRKVMFFSLRALMCMQNFLILSYPILLQETQDYGGPRKEFFRLILKEIKEAFFDNGFRALFKEKYVTVGVLLGMHDTICYNDIDKLLQSFFLCFKTEYCSEWEDPNFHWRRCNEQYIF